MSFEAELLQEKLVEVPEVQLDSCWFACAIYDCAVALVCGSANAPFDDVARTKSPAAIIVTTRASDFVVVMFLTRSLYYK